MLREEQSSERGYERHVLLAWIGSKDPVLRDDKGRPVKDAEGWLQLGPILSLLRSPSFRKAAPISHLELFYTIDERVGDFSERQQELQRFFGQQAHGIPLAQHPAERLAVTDHRAIYRCVQAEWADIRRRHAIAETQYWVFLSPGTPQMHTAWVLLRLAGVIPARLAQAIPPNKRHGGDDWHEVSLALDDFPDLARQVAALARTDATTAENGALRVRVAELEAELALINHGGGAIGVLPLGDNFNLRAFLDDQERAIYTRAFREAGGNGADTARLLGITPAACRARIRALGLTA